MSSAAFSEFFWTSRDGLRLYGRDYAPKTDAGKLPIIAIHGLTRNSTDFGSIARILQNEGYRIIAIDVRGRGKSQYAADPMTYVPTTYACDVVDLLDHLSIDKAIFLGTSMGGLITMCLAALKPDAIAAAILNDVGPEVAPEGLARIAAYTGKPVVIENWDDATEYARQINEVAFPHYDRSDWEAFARRIFKEDENGVPVLAYDPDISAPIRAAGSGALVPDLWPLFRVLAERPTLIVRGGTSDLLNTAIAGRMIMEGKNTRLIEVPDIGHAPMLDEPEASEAILNFLSALN
ncbi:MULTISPECIES: alpha/beta fold hydrolase [unclassified Brevundimonas]|uniref:alpha/beta fold hydrolase n=1 Tax=unclassified Brevundimonas TaxID=2622653 RepID=UPI0025B802AE|nr:MULTISPECIES: alpha/beta hydrolase [unclassified Brevundimonas]